MSETPRTISAVRLQRRGSKRRLIEVDGEPWRCLSADVLRHLDLHESDPFDEQDLLDRLASVEPSLARERALRLIAYRERSAAEVLARLLDDGYPDDTAAGTVADLTGSGLIDDVRFAESFARSLIELRGLGRARALRMMTQRGIPDDVAAAALDGLAPASCESERARTAAVRSLRPGDSIDRLAARLHRRGFTPAASLRAAREALALQGGDGDEPAPEWD